MADFGHSHEYRAVRSRSGSLAYEAETDPLPAAKTKPRAKSRPLRFSLAPLDWQRFETCASQDGDGPAPQSDAPFLQAHLSADADLRGHLTASADELLHLTRGGLLRGERALAAAAVSRHIGCLLGAGFHGRRAVEGLRRRREVDLLLEEGVPTPLTGRLGAVIEASADLTRSPVRPDKRKIWRLEEEKLDDQEIVDLILVSGFALWSSLLTLALGRAFLPEQEEER